MVDGRVVGTPRVGIGRPEKEIWIGEGSRVGWVCCLPKGPGLEPSTVRSMGPLRYRESGLIYDLKYKLIKKIYQMELK